jgi:transcription factor TFIIIB component B''
MIHEGSDKARKNGRDANEKASKRPRTSKRGQGRTSDRGRSPSEPGASSTPRPRSRAPSIPSFNPDTDPGGGIDPTAMTMAALCVDIGQGRISSKAAEIVNNHSAWKLQNREKRARMRATMEAKKYGRPDDEAEEPTEKLNQAGEHQPSTSTASSSIAATITDNTGNGFDYSQDLTTSRYNVQVRIGPNGETVIDEDSLVVDRADNQGTENFTHVTESDYTKFVNSATYGKRFRGSRWSAEETDLFFDVRNV